MPIRKFEFRNQFFEGFERHCFSSLIMSGLWSARCGGLQAKPARGILTGRANAGHAARRAGASGGTITRRIIVETVDR